MPDINIQVYFTPKNFEQAIKRHGQYLRVYSSLPCYCIKNGSPDPNCLECLGRGHIFFPFKSIRRIDKYMSLGGNKIQTEGKIKSINQVYNKIPYGYTVSMFYENTIYLNENLNRGEYVYIDYEENLEHDYSGPAIYEGNNILRVSINGISTQQGHFTGKISSVQSVRNLTTNRPINYSSFWEDLILLEDAVSENDEIEVVCKYVDPIKMLVVGVQPSKSKEKPGPYDQADASLTFSGLIDLGKGDIVTQLKAESKASFVGEYIGNDTYKTNYFHLSSIVMLKDKLGYIEDAQIIRDNEIYFPTRKPEGRFSASIMYYPTYTLDSTPNLRYAEDKILPKRSQLKFYTKTSPRESRPNTTNIFRREESY